MKILLAVDGSECSQAAVHEIAARPWEEDSELKILAVNAPPFPYPIPDPFLVLEGARINWMKEERERLETLVKETAASIQSTEHGSRLRRRFPRRLPKPSPAMRDPFPGCQGL